MLSYQWTGSGTPVVFIHGFMENTEMWNDLKEIKGIRAICVDLNGHGDSKLFEDKIAIAEQAAEILKHINIIGEPSVQVVGHSLGGYVALEMFKQAPHIVEHVTLLHSHPKADSESKKKDRERVAELVQTKAAAFIQEAIPNLFHHPEEHKETIREYCEIAKKMDPKAIALTSLAMGDRADNSKLMQEFPDRFTFIQGRYDKLISAVETKKFAEENGISYIELPESAHMGHEEETVLCKEILLSILI